MDSHPLRIKRLHPPEKQLNGQAAGKSPMFQLEISNLNSFIQNSWLRSTMNSTKIGGIRNPSYPWVWPLNLGGGFHSYGKAQTFRVFHKPAGNPRRSWKIARWKQWKCTQNECKGPKSSEFKSFMDLFCVPVLAFFHGFCWMAVKFIESQHRSAETMWFWWNPGTYFGPLPKSSSFWLIIGWRT